MFELKIFVWVQTFFGGPPVPPRNFCHLDGGYVYLLVLRDAIFNLYKNSFVFQRAKLLWTGNYILRTHFEKYSWLIQVICLHIKFSWLAIHHLFLFSSNQKALIYMNGWMVFFGISDYYQERSGNQFRYIFEWIIWVFIGPRSDHSLLMSLTH